jgi:Rrf2 family iron-sulfur cluster assembly transcriptional regulator
VDSDTVRLEITRRADLAVRALLALADGRKLKASGLAEALGTTPAFVPQVLGPLVKSGWVRSDPGPTGGYSLVVGLDSLNVLEVVEAIDGPTESGRCVVEDRPCSRDGQVCVLHEPWARARGQLTASLRATPVARLVGAVR